MPRATLIIPTLERPELLREVVGALDRQSTQDFETVIIDQSDTPNEPARKLCEGSKRPMRYVHEARKSLPNARNVGARLASSDILIFIDDDVTLDEQFIEAHFAPFADSNVAAVAGRITGAYDDGPPAVVPVGAFNPWLVKVTRNFHTTTPFDSVEQLPGGNFSVHRELYHKLGGFDPDTFGGPASIGEETDFALRLRKGGHRIVFAPAAHLVHLRAPRGGCRDDSRVRWTYWHGHNMGALSRRHCPWYTWLPFLWLQCLRYLAHAIRGMNPCIWAAGCIGTLTGFWRGFGYHRVL